MLKLSFARNSCLMWGIRLHKSLFYFYIEIEFGRAGFLIQIDVR